MLQRTPMILVLAAALGVPAIASAQKESLDQVLARTLDDRAAAQDTAASQDPTLENAPSSTEGAICRTMTDLAQRGRRERVCMTQERWNVLIAAARRPQRGAATIKLSALKSSSRTR